MMRSSAWLELLAQQQRGAQVGRGGVGVAGEVGGGQPGQHRQGDQPVGGMPADW